jgi:hypothetical protein
MFAPQGYRKGDGIDYEMREKQNVIMHVLLVSDIITS